MGQTTLSRLLCGLLLTCAPALQAQTAAITILPAGSQPTAADASHFTGAAQVESRFSQTAPARLGGGLVSFEPGARTAWHSHPLGQTLFVTAGEGWVQIWGGPVQTMRQGDVVLIPPGVKHWHGATASRSMSHFAVSESLEGNSVVWMEKVSAQVYERNLLTPE
jgi:quercetin dioxygenase-like cupin family protein